jgi:cystathionine gamma-synthase
MPAPTNPVGGPTPHLAPGGYAPATLAVTAGRPPVAVDAPVNPPVVLSSTYGSSPSAVGAGDRVYGRWANPTWEAFEDALGALEGGHALAFASGMAATAAVLHQVRDGGVVVLPRHSYPGTASLVDEAASRGRLVARPVPLDDTDAVLAALRGADLLWVESPTNPMLEVAELPDLCAAARRGAVRVAVDNTFATPLVQRPLDAGADVVVHSATKYLSGHSDAVLGAVVTRDPDLLGALRHHRTLHGAVPGPWEAWLALRGIRTLHLRVERAGANAVELARRLVTHPAVDRVRHPSLPDDPAHERATRLMRGYGAMIGVEVRGGADAAERVAAAVRLWTHATSLGGVESLIERRRRYPSEAPTVPEGLLRLSVGVEDVEDLWADLDGALGS